MFRFILIVLIFSVLNTAKASPSRNKVVEGAAATAYQKAKLRYQALQSSSQKKRYRHHWINVIDLFRSIAKIYPKTVESTRAQFTVALLWQGLAQVSGAVKDRDKALHSYLSFSKKYPKSRLADDALVTAAKLLLKRGEQTKAITLLDQVISSYATGDMAEAAKAILVRFAGKTRELTQKGEQVSVHSLKKNLFKKFHIVLDPGHGGEDSGAIGGLGQKEKTIALAVAKKVAKRLRDHGVTVTLTRSTDRFITLQQRAAIANAVDANRFLSIHVNATKNRKVGGLETYYLNVASNRYSERLASIENKGAEKPPEVLEFILNDMSTKAYTRQSVELAHQVQQHLVQAVRKSYHKILDRGVKGALFYVLLGVHMPAVLCEISFITHVKEGKLLTTKRYQTTIAKAIAEGLLKDLSSPSIEVP